MKFSVERAGVFVPIGSDIKNIDNEILNKLVRHINIGSKQLVLHIKDMIRKRQSLGRRYSRGGGKYHIASLPGYPPNDDTGKLRKGTYYKPAVKNTTQSVIESYIETNPMRAGAIDNYAVYLESGTKRMEKRPFFYTGIDKRIKDTTADINILKMIRQVSATIQNVMSAHNRIKGKRRVITR